MLDLYRVGDFEEDDGICKHSSPTSLNSELGQTGKEH